MIASMEDVNFEKKSPSGDASPKTKDGMDFKIQLSKDNDEKRISQEPKIVSKHANTNYNIDEIPKSQGNLSSTSNQKIQNRFYDQKENTPQGNFAFSFANPISNNSIKGLQVYNLLFLFKIRILSLKINLVV